MKGLTARLRPIRPLYARARYVECCVERPLAVDCDAARARAVGRKDRARKKLENWNSGTNGPRSWLAIWRDGRDEWLKPN
jgi:hypothetical protein